MINLENPPEWFVNEIACLVMDGVSTNWEGAQKIAKDIIARWRETEKKPAEKCKGVK